MPRLFYGLAIPPDCKTQGAAVQKGLQQRGVVAGNWSAPELFHITVLFLGELAPDLLPFLDEVGEAAAKSVRPFALRLTHAGAFERNRILWLGLAEDDGYETLQALHSSVRRHIVRHGGISVESRPYRPHLTLARKLNVPTFQAAGSGEGFPQQGISFPVTELCLFESTRVNGKLTYPVLRSYPLSGHLT
ncbi:RNA 2',3'-cyclic phosphodiesterase [Alicyclobacillus pomorum]|uniref:RNA 2',3'-cyclic phosphodiesterase n=1 Tax=Alicyclobacillus pomorum TaxID=204470 RepID=UPI000478EC7D|nr:RNA 2',3'-cyclic phosphodiesterase [Alicyclobacillus pomorum]